MRVPMKPETTEYGAYFPPTQEGLDLYEAMGFPKRWSHFTFAELRCKGSGALRVHYKTMDALEVLRSGLGMPIPINSYYRCAEYNEQVGGSPNSMHLLGRAVDTPILNGNMAGRAKLVFAAQLAGFSGFGFYKGFNHIDTGRTRFWVGSEAPSVFGEAYPLGFMND